MQLLNPLSVARAHSLFADKKFSAKCLSTDSVGDCVYIRADRDSEGNYRVGRANPKLSSKMPAVGIIVEKSAASDCMVQWIGEVPDVLGLVPGRSLWVGIDGRPTQSPENIVPGHGETARVQVIGMAMASDTALLTPTSQFVIRVG